jgi:hypothetical protein
LGEETTGLEKAFEETALASELEELLEVMRSARVKTETGERPLVDLVMEARKGKETTVSDLENLGLYIHREKGCLAVPVEAAFDLFAKTSRAFADMYKNTKQFASALKRLSVEHGRYRLGRLGRRVRAYLIPLSVFLGERENS